MSPMARLSMIDYPGADHPSTYYGNTKMVLPAGDEKVTVKIGQGVGHRNHPAAAGQTVEKDIVVGVGHVVANAFYVAGGDKVDAGGLTFHVVKAKKKIDGSREDVLTTYGPDSKFDLPPGDYVAIASMDQAVVEQPFSVKVGELNELKVTLNAGVLAITAPGASKIEDPRGEEGHPGQPQVAGSATTRITRRRPGRRLRDRRRKARQWRHKEGTATVKAGERTEVTVQ